MGKRRGRVPRSSTRGSRIKVNKGYLSDLCHRAHLELGLPNTQKDTQGLGKLPALGSHNKIKYLPRPQ